MIAYLSLHPLKGWIAWPPRVKGNGGTGQRYLLTGPVPRHCNLQPRSRRRRRVDKAVWWQEVTWKSMAKQDRNGIIFYLGFHNCIWRKLATLASTSPGS